jgi:hypothetical protein
MQHKFITNSALIFTMLYLAGTGIVITQPLFASESESDEAPSEFDEQSTQVYNDMQLLSFAIQHINEALQMFMEGNSENATQQLTISEEQIATVLGRLHAASQASE